VKSPVPYFGGKARIAQQIAALLPAHGHYVEPYAGGLSVLLAKTPSQMETASDISGELMTFWRVLRDRPDELIRACALTPHSRAELDAAWGPSSDDLETARRVWIRLTQSQGGALRKAGWRLYINPAGTHTTMPARLTEYVDRMAAAAERLHGVSLESLPALDLIAKYGRHKDVLLYVDPPYLGSTRNAGSRYEAEMHTEDEHRELAAALAACRAAVVLSGYHSPLYHHLYADWHRYEIAATTSNATSDKGRTEVLWANRELGQQPSLFDTPAC
jgi:DNA adenine methylase